jgi:hypothetical protein
MAKQAVLSAMVIKSPPWNDLKTPSYFNFLGTFASQNPSESETISNCRVLTIGIFFILVNIALLRSGGNIPVFRMIEQAPLSGEISSPGRCKNGVWTDFYATSGLPLQTEEANLTVGFLCGFEIPLMLNQLFLS